VGVDPGAVSRFLDAVERAPGVELHSLVIVRHGAVAVEGWWAPYEADDPHLLYSLSKSVASTAVALAVEEGLFGLDDFAVDFFPELAAETAHPRTRGMRIRDLLAMSSGHRQEMWLASLAVDPHDVVRGFFQLPPEEEPGSIFAYNQPCTITLAAIVQRVSGQTLVEYLRPRLLDPLGIGPVGWLSDGAGRQLGSSGLHMTTEDIAKFGLLYLGRGEWEGERLLSKRWVNEATTARIGTESQHDDPDWRLGYGFQFWMARHGYRGDGMYGQFCLVLPEHDTVIAITGQTTETQALLDTVWEFLLPGFGEPSTRPQREGDALRERLAGLVLDSVQGDAPLLEGTYRPASGSDQAGMSAIRAQFSEAGLTLSLEEGSDRLEVPIGERTWVRSQITAASGATERDGTVAIDVIFLHTPHRLRMRFPAGTREFTAVWATAPGHTHLQKSELRSPDGADRG
jgi:CubicO group peptidase (beta-lactamase class C family)